MDSLRAGKSENWMVGWTDRDTVYMLTPGSYEKESRHIYSEDEYIALLKHELAHLFSNILNESIQVPVWLLEGISIFLAGQLVFIKKPESFKNFLNYFDDSGVGVNTESGFAVEFLVERFGKGKLLDLLVKSKGVKTEEDFAKLFEDVYDFELEYSNFEVF